MRVSLQPLSKNRAPIERAVSDSRSMRAARWNGSVGGRNQPLAPFSETFGVHYVISNKQLLRKLADSPLLDGISESNFLHTRELHTARSESRGRESVKRESPKRDGDLLSHR
jgi:hypothetical protein